jgi:hypothetical protein
MTAVKDFESVGTRAFYRPMAQVSFEQAVDLCAEAIRRAREVGLTDIVVNSLGLTGFSPPDVFARYSMATKFVESAGASLRVAVVTRPEIIDPQKIAMLMMQNRGVTCEVFTNEPEALKWLDARQAATRTRD